MIRRFVLWVVVFVLSASFLDQVYGATFTLNDGRTLEGEPVAPNAQGVVIKAADGSFLPREGWTNFTQEALQELAKLPKAKPFVDPFLDVEEPETAKKPAVEIKPKAIKRLERPDPRAGLGAILSSPLSIVMFILLYAANIYAAFEISVFRNYHPGLVCGIAAIAPVFGPIIFLSLPTRIQKTQDELAAESMAQHMAETPQHFPAHAHAHAGHEDHAGAGGAHEAAPAETKANITVYQRGQTTFNRRFFETKFAGFLRVVPGEAEKDMEIYVRSARGEHIGNRLTRILQNELHLQINKEGATADVIIPFTDIYEVQVRPRNFQP